jgi:hypothetical protein
MRTIIHLVLFAVVATGCGDGDDIDSDEEARRAYLGLDGSVAKSITLGFDGFNAATNANIPDQTTDGTAGGTLTIGGKVDAGTSTNKVMTLSVGMVAYTDGPFVINDDDDTIEVVYDTDVDVALQPVINMKLQDFPTGTIEGTLIGTYSLSGGVEGEVTLNLAFTGDLEDLGDGDVGRVAGSVHVTGTAVTPNDGSFTVDVTL